jgi:hypothetical protein
MRNSVTAVKQLSMALGALFVAPLFLSLLAFDTSAYVAPGSCRLDQLKSNFSCERIQSAGKNFLKFPDGEIQFNTLALIKTMLKEESRREYPDPSRREAFWHFESSKQTYFEPEKLFEQLRQKAETVLAQYPLGENRSFLLYKLRSMRSFIRQDIDSACAGVNEVYASAAYAPDLNAVGICPATLRYNKLAAALVIAHEIGHSVDPHSIGLSHVDFLEPVPSLVGPQKFIHSEAYTPSTCTDKYRKVENYDPKVKVTPYNPGTRYPLLKYLFNAHVDFEKDPAVLALEFGRLKNLNAELICLRKNQDEAMRRGVYFICATLYRPRCMEKFSEENESGCPSLTSLEMNAASCMDHVGEELERNYTNEWLADQLGSLVIDAFLQDERSHGRTYSFLIDQVLPTFFHGSCDSEKLIVNRHPLGRTRIETFLSSSPELRKVVGCKSSP